MNALAEMLVVLAEGWREDKWQIIKNMSFVFGVGLIGILFLIGAGLK